MNQITRTSPGGAVGAAAKPLRQVASVRELLVNEQAKQQLAAVAAEHMRPERMMRLMANALRTTPQLGDCTPLSLLGAMMTCASLGVEPNTPLGHAYLIPFKNKSKGITEVQFILGYKGMIDLARRSGHIVSITANVHYSDDELWIYEEGTEAQLRHRPGHQAGEKLHAYAIARFTDGGHAYVVLPWSKVMSVRDGSQGYQRAKRYGRTDTPWIEHEHEMGAKTAVRALFKYLPISVEKAGERLSDAMVVDDQRIDFAAYAQDPDRGYIAADDDGDAPAGEAIDAETGEVTDDRPLRPAQRKAGSPRASRMPVPDDAPPDDSAEDEQSIAADGEAYDRLEALTRTIISDMEAGGTEAAMQFYADQIEDIRNTVPALHARIMEAAKTGG